MDRVVFVAASGAKQILNRQASNANNLANASTTGFQADFSAARAQPVFGAGHGSRVYAMAERPGTDMGRGTVISTGRDLDVAVKGDGWFAVQGRDGQEAYTRAGDLQVTTTGQLVNGAGFAVLGDGGPIVLPPFENLVIGGDGTISVQPVGQAPSTLAVVSRIKMVEDVPGGMTKGNDGLVRASDGKELDPSANVSLVSGALETSNVSMVDSMTNMIELSRQFEMHVRVMETAKENDEAAARIMELG